MASGLRSTRTQYRTVGATSLKPAFGTTSGASRPDWSLSSRNKTQASSEPTRTNAVEGGQGEKPLKKSPSDSGRKRKDKRHLRERRHGTGVVILPGGGAQNDDQAGEARQTMENTKMNESLGMEDYSPSPSEVSSSSTPSRSSRLAHDDVDVDRMDKQDLLDRIEQLEKALDQKTKEVETLKSENQALLRVVNQVSSLKIK